MDRNRRAWPYPTMRTRRPTMIAVYRPIQGTTLFDGEQAQRGYALNRMCYSFNDRNNRRAFLEDEMGYCARYGLDREQRDAIKRRDFLAMIDAGGNIYYLA